METAKDLFQCDNCEGAGERILGPRMNNKHQMQKCSYCTGSGTSDTKIAAYFRDHLEDALAGLEIIKAMRRDEVNEILFSTKNGGSGLHFSGGKWKIFDDEGMYNNRVFDSPLEAINKLLS